MSTELEVVPSEKKQEIILIADTKPDSIPLKISVNRKGKMKVTVKKGMGGMEALKKITATKEDALAENILRSGALALESILSVHKTKAEGMSESVNVIMQSMNDYQPKDAIEARFVTQATALFQHGMDRLGASGRAQQIHNTESNTNQAIKLLRAYNETIEALGKYRRGGVQQIIVQNTSNVVAGQAVVNNFGIAGALTKNPGETSCLQ